MAGIDTGRNFPEKSIRFAYEKLRSFAHYKGLKSFKDKFSPRWVNKYIIYNNDYDLFSLPGVLRKVIKP
jgi:phosphatidylglycerol lysyltransferase